MEQKPSFAEIIGGDQLVLVDFFATWCGPCQMMQPVLIELSKRMGDKVKIIKIDVDRNPATAQQYQVQGVPTFALFRQGRVLWKRAGAMPVHQLEQAIAQYRA